MKITLKKVLLCGLGLLTVLLMLLAFALPIKVTYTVFGVPSAFRETMSSSIWSAMGGTPGPFNKVFYWNAFWLATENSGPLETTAKVGDITMQVCAIGGLVCFILALLAVVGAFFIPRMKGARVLCIVVHAIALVTAFIFAIIAIAGLSLSINGTTTDVSGAPIILMLLAFLSFIAMIVVPCVVKEKVLVGPKEE